ncbi:hypothetical protein [Brachybacterium phenoliresistens]|uniref:hypothetical protein n=1 Tax=Brachybacterium phenoliresistens TaxID=396014 RepID=UPI001E52911A|nr:hypothetical protein [Brachybacterium phenoliresistens]
MDLNPTAVELAEVSLWLDTMAPGLKAPWFGLRLRAGNSLIGARHSIYSRAALDTQRLKDVVQTSPRPLPVTTVRDDPAGDGKRPSVSGGIFHFLLPGEGWLAAASDTEIKKLAPAQAKALRDHAKGWGKKLTKTQLEILEELSQRVEELWNLALRRVVAAEANARRAIPVWGAETTEGGEVTRAQIEQSLNDSNSSYQRLRLVMDAWCALWFWPVLPDDEVSPPTFEEWLDTLQKILGRSLEVVAHKGKSKGPGPAQIAVDDVRTWQGLDAIESMFSVSGAANIDVFTAETPWLQRARDVAREQRFFHWELDFAAAFDRGGFNLQVGNPPWVRPTLDVPALLADFDPWWVLANKPSEVEKMERRESTLARGGPAQSLLLGTRDISATAEFAGAKSMYPELVGTQPDLYRNFMARTWAHLRDGGVVTLIHPASHLTDARGYSLRGATFSRLRRHWRFINDLKLFREVHNLVEYSINVYVNASDVDFLSAVSVYHPAVIEGSLRHDGHGPQPGFKDVEGNWDLSPHRARIQRNGRRQLELWHALMESGDPEVPFIRSRMLSSVNGASAGTLAQLAKVASIGGMTPKFSSGWHESGGRRAGHFESRWGAPESWRDVILQGPYFAVGNPFASARNKTMSSNRDYSAVDLERLAPDALPITEYKPIYGTRIDETGSEVADTRRYDADYGKWVLSYDPVGKPDKTTPVRDHYRVMWRRMAATTGERTLIPAIFPPGAGHVHPVHAIGCFSGSIAELVLAAASMSSLVADFEIRSTVSGDIHKDAVDRLPRILSSHPLAPTAILRTLRLNCLTTAYADLWRDCFDPSFAADSWTCGLTRPNRPALGDVGPEWTAATPLRIDEDRRQALVEIDAIMAIVTGISIDDLVTIYRTQFGVLNDYDRGEGKKAYIFDANGRQIPSSVRTAWNKAGRPETGLPLEDRTAVHPSATGTGRTVVHEQPFRILDREADMRTAYAEFRRRMEESS